jgi:hypothetical protein
MMKQMLTTARTTDLISVHNAHHIQCNELQKWNWIHALGQWNFKGAHGGRPIFSGVGYFQCFTYLIQLFKAFTIPNPGRIALLKIFFVVFYILFFILYFLTNTFGVLKELTFSISKRNY